MPRGRIPPTETSCRNCLKTFSKIKPAVMHCSTECRLEYNYKQKQSKRNKSYDRWYALRYNYNVSKEQYEAMVEEQQNKCAICLETPQLLFVDHCHNQGTIRGLLCRTCNAALGLFKDKLENLDRAKLYLSKGVK